MPKITTEGLSDVQIDRIKWFVAHFYHQAKDFIRKMDVVPKTYYRLLDGENVGISTINLLQKGGVNIGWLFTGEGLPFANNSIGWQLLYQFKNVLWMQDRVFYEDLQKKVLVSKAIFKFININYGSIENFCKENNLNLLMLHFQLTGLIDLEDVVLKLKTLGLTETFLAKEILGLQNAESVIFERNKEYINDLSNIMDEIIEKINVSKNIINTL
jgi:hypothetical protein